ncbi:DUF1045 domain-containing protein [Rhodobacter sp. Har01]|uniref:DUF1045 domain-containing protein n=1 Tax=Rhodobacter sp. Har01 TaxID=2883999 RepID=UPI001D0886F1|nr:DUF1045 domain-containing protein [Rhodobacter sp. Har01]MCB6179781.1 DUF1045 domain-containing protein [Rhodobacter sp. Har01]
MDQMKRFAVYYAPRPGGLADRAAEWLGWDAATGTPVAQPQLAGLPVPATGLTRDPARYGFHGTLRAPFRLAERVTAETVAETVAALAARHSPVVCDGLRLECLDGFLALTPEGCEAALLALAAAVVEGTNSLRAPPTEAEIIRRRPERLTSRQHDLLHLWGYPYVMEEFRFHLTLTDRLPPDQSGPVAQVLAAHFAPVLPKPFLIQDLCLFGEDEAGRFHLLARYALTG